MGTRAMIRVDGKPVFATHWDGYPESLGQDLAKLKKKDIPSVMRVAGEHSINFASKPLVRHAENLMRSKLRNRAGYEWVFKKGAKFVSPIRQYDDFAEYEYDVNTKTGEVRVRPRVGPWSARFHGQWEKMTPTKKKLKQSSDKLYDAYLKTRPKLKKMLEGIT